MKRILKLGTRSSQLALTQSNTVADSLRELGFDVEVVPIHTQGDVVQASLKSLGGVGVFAAALRLALLTGDCDIAVHSFKDLPTAPVPGLMIGAVPRRADFSDVLVCRDGLNLESLPAGSRVGTGSPRRAASVLALRPDLQIVDIRGNVGTRLGRVAGIDAQGAGDLDAVVLARAGLQRLGSKHADAQVLPGLPAPAQGALAVEVRSDDAEVIAAVSALDDMETRACAFAERAVLAGLQAGCAAPVGAYASLSDGTLALSATVLSTDGQRRVDLTTATEFPEPTPGERPRPADTAGAADASMPVEGAGQQSATPPASDRPARDRAATRLGLDLAAELLRLGAGEVTDLAATKPTRASHEAPKPAQSAAGTPDTRSGETQNPDTGTLKTRTTETGAHASSEHEANASRWGSKDLPLGQTQRERPLTGRTVLMPRPAGDHLVKAVENAGARVIAQPFTRTILTPSFDVKPALKALADGSYTWVVITSPRTLTALACHVQGVRNFDEDVPTGALSDLLKSAKQAGTNFAALGEATTRALRDIGIEPDLSTGAKASQEELSKAFSTGPSCQYYSRAWFPASSLARSYLADEWALRGWEVDRTSVYTTAASSEIGEQARTGWTHALIDAVVFTAGSNARAAVELLGPPAPSIKVVAFGDPSAKVISELGMKVGAIAPTQNAQGIITALQEVFEAE
ncbi:MAG: hydroxymethylbilane synthase [Actinomycetaceae bacterium]|nr:hydroxymethylbilane synthase [Actinomycetaceae bacterium]